MFRPHTDVVAPTSANHVLLSDLPVEPSIVPCSYACMQGLGNALPLKHVSLPFLLSSGVHCSRVPQWISQLPWGSPILLHNQTPLHEQLEALLCWGGLYARPHRG